MDAEFRSLPTPAYGDGVVALLPEMLQFNRTDLLLEFVFLLIIQRHDRTDRCAGEMVKERGELGWVVHSVGVLKPAEQRQRMLARSPLVMIARQEERLPPFVNPQPRIDSRWHIVRRHISSLCLVVSALHVETVLRAELLLELQERSPFFQIVVRSPPVVGMIGKLRRVTA